MKTITSLFIFLVAIIFSSCGTFKDVTIEKRHHRKGYYVHVHQDREKQNEVVSVNQNPQNEVASVSLEEEKIAPVGEVSPREAISATPNKAFTKEKSKKNVVTSTPFKKGSAVFQEKDPVESTKPAPEKPAQDGDDEHVVALFLLIILAIILPPLAVLLADGFGIHFLVDLIFWLLGYGFILFIPGGGYIYLGIFGLIAIIYALFVIFELI